ncbi:IclR family transcriptional regulator [Microbacterium invictum]|uniref:Glycerol operon regulatory protein n=1 Tax=Microbacterium invictum TaxID=515415 RepID=A0AA40VP16_9MICO|nr:IclR family transcriptional regulator [Microbacterium invictum]MBB4141407.1 IclR family pca regulon transcriptional regulator [Microbacterium invictum]
MTGATPDAPADIKRGQYTVEALAKGLRVMSLFTERQPEWRLRDIAQATGIPTPTAFRIVATLVEEGYLEQLDDGQYRPDVKVLTLGGAALRASDLATLATPRLRRLGEQTGETTNLAVLAGDRILYIVRLRNADLVTANIQVGSTLPAAFTSIGKLLLAFAPAKETAATLDRALALPSSGPNAIADAGSLRLELAEIRERGWALQDEELALGLRSVAAPVRDADGAVIAGINVAVQSSTWPSQRLRDELAPAVLAAADEISGLLGWSGAA